VCHAGLLYLEARQSDPLEAEGGETTLSDPPKTESRETNPPISPRNQTVPARVTPPIPKGSNSGGSGARRSAGSEPSYVTDEHQNAPGLNGPSPTEHDNEISSDVQEGEYSDAGASVATRTAGHVSVAVWLIGS
jgi:hypothetical protein